MRTESQSAEPQGHESPHLILLEREVRGHHEVLPALMGSYCLTTELIPGPLGLFLLLRKNLSEAQTAPQVKEGAVEIMSAGSRDPPREWRTAPHEPHHCPPQLRMLNWQRVSQGPLQEEPGHPPGLETSTLSSI